MNDEIQNCMDRHPAGKGRPAPATPITYGAFLKGVSGVEADMEMIMLLPLGEQAVNVARRMRNQTTPTPEFDRVLVDVAMQTLDMRVLAREAFERLILKGEAAVCERGRR